MINKTPFFILLSFFFLQTTKNALSPLSPQEAINHFYKITHRFLSKYKFSELEGGDNIRSTRYESTDVQVSHVIDVMIEKQVSGFEYGFFNAKKADVFKKVREYYQEEMDLQAPVFEELVARLIVLGTSSRGKETIYFNTIEDVKQKILGISASKYKLTFDEEVKNGDIFLTLRSNQEVLALFTLTIKNDNNDKNYYIDIGFTISNSNEEQTQSARVYMFEKDQSQFELAMSPITKKLSISSYINNLQEVEAQFKNFMAKYFNFIKLSATPYSKDSAKGMSFNLTFEKQGAECELFYIPPVLGEAEKVAAYQITITRDGKQFSSIKFKRMTIQLFEEYLKNLGIDKLFEDLWTKIKRIFKEKYDKKLHSIYPDTLFIENKERSFFFSNMEHYFIARTDRNDVMSISYVANNDHNWTLSWNSPRPEMKFARFNFDKENFSSEVLDKFFDMTLATHLALVAPQNRVLL